jgi:hypothetical protein
MKEDPEASVLTARRAAQHQTVTKQAADEPTKAVFRVWGIAFLFLLKHSAVAKKPFCDGARKCRSNSC